MLGINLEQVLAPFPQDRFLREVWGQKQLYIPGTSSKFSGLFDWSNLNTILEHHRLDAPRLRVEHAQKRRDELAFVTQKAARRGGFIPRLNVPRLYELLREGATLVLDAVDETHPPLIELSSALSSVFGHGIQINLYASWGTVAGFGLHWDDHDVMILQISGRKNWKVYEATRSYPMYRDVYPEEEQPTGNPTWEGMINPGDFLYIPRGFWHDAVGIGEATLHLTIGSTNPTGIDLLNWLADEMRDLEVFRQDLPQFSSLEAKASHSQTLKRTILSRWTGDFIDRFLEHRKAAMDSRPRLSFPSAIHPDPIPTTDNFTVRLSISTWSAYSIDNESQTVRICADRREWIFTSAVVPILDLLLTRTAHSFAELRTATCGQISDRDLRNFLAQLLVEGLVHIFETPE